MMAALAPPPLVRDAGAPVVWTAAAVSPPPPIATCGGPPPTPSSRTARRRVLVATVVLVAAIAVSAGAAALVASSITTSARDEPVASSSSAAFLAPTAALGGASPRRAGANPATRRGGAGAPEGSTPAHAGCFIVRDGRLLVERHSHDGVDRYDLPSGQTDWLESAKDTAVRETYLKTGYLVEPQELLGVMRNDVHVFRCELLRPKPVKPRGEGISWRGWLDKGDVAAELTRGGWLAMDAERYVEWLAPK